VEEVVKIGYKKEGEGGLVPNKKRKKNKKKEGFPAIRRKFGMCRARAGLT